jgi:hypothetical protein
MKWVTKLQDNNLQESNLNKKGDLLLKKLRKGSISKERVAIIVMPEHPRIKRIMLVIVFNLDFKCKL